MEFGKKETSDFEAENISFDEGADLFGASSAAEKFIETASEQIFSEKSVDAVASASNPYVAAGAKAAQIGKKVFETLANNIENSKAKEQSEGSSSGGIGVLIAAAVMIASTFIIVIPAWVLYLASVYIPMVEIAKQELADETSSPMKYIEWCGDESFVPIGKEIISCKICKQSGVVYGAAYTSDVCTTCAGASHVSCTICLGRAKVDCPECNGGYYGQSFTAYSTNAVSSLECQYCGKTVNGTKVLIYNSCATCGGTGARDVCIILNKTTPTHICTENKGAGSVMCQACNATGLIGCDLCHGTGYYGTCIKCNGAGKYEEISYDTVWSAAFVCWCANECGYAEYMFFPKTNSASELYAWFDSALETHVISMEEVYEPQAGDLIFFGEEISRVGIIISFDAGSNKVIVIEGVGEKVCQTEYYIFDESIYGYANPAYPLLIDVLFKFIN